MSPYGDSFRIWLPQHYGQQEAPELSRISVFSQRDFPGKTIDFPKKLWFFSLGKSKDEDMRPRKDSQRGRHMVQGGCTPAGDDTTSEPQGRNALTGAPVKASMSDGFHAVTRVEPWNTAITVSHP